jgi:AcrR family transcriptional regulator
MLHESMAKVSRRVVPKAQRAHQTKTLPRRRRGGAPGHPRRGRPRKLVDGGPDTRTRLVNAAANAFVDHGFETTTMEEIATRAGVTTTAIYNHFSSKDDLMLHSARLTLETALSTLQACASITPHDGGMAYVRAYMAPDFARTRQLLGEIHIAAMRHSHLAEMLTHWHRERANAAIAGEQGGPSATGVKAFFMILMGICHLDSLSGIKTPPDALVAAMEAAARAALGF